MAQSEDPTKAMRTNEAKWSRELMQTGWTAIPNVIIERQRALGFDPLDVNILLHLFSYWWTPEGKPHPSKKTIAEAINVDPRTVQRHIARLEKAGMIRREQRREAGKGSKTNIYHFEGLIAAAKPYAREKALELEEKQALREARAARKGKAKVVPARAE
jgi:predicted transcriptional regulator